MKCDTRKCPSPAVCEALWGPITEPRKYSARHCDRCVNLLYDQLKGLVESGQQEWAMKSLSDKDKAR